MTEPKPFDELQAADLPDLKLSEETTANEITVEEQHLPAESDALQFQPPRSNLPNAQLTGNDRKVRRTLAWALLIGLAAAQLLCIFRLSEYSRPLEVTARVTQSEAKQSTYKGHVSHYGQIAYEFTWEGTKYVGSDWSEMPNTIESSAAFVAKHPVGSSVKVMALPFNPNENFSPSRHGLRFALQQSVFLFLIGLLLMMVSVVGRAPKSINRLVYSKIACTFIALAVVPSLLSAPYGSPAAGMFIVIVLYVWFSPRLNPSPKDSKTNSDV